MAIGQPSSTAPTNATNQAGAASRSSTSAQPNCHASSPPNSGTTSRTKPGATPARAATASISTATAYGTARSGPPPVSSSTPSMNSQQAATTSGSSHHRAPVGTARMKPRESGTATAA
ncbi:hypothetical protein ACFQ0D_17225, partial [Micromonospora zhanjiangensis]